MRAQEVKMRLEKELGLPDFEGVLAEKDYTEEEYSALKQQLLNYFEEYVRNVEN